MEITCDGFILREWALTDTDSLARHANNIHIWNNVRDYFPHPYTEKDGREFIDRVRWKRKPTDFAIVLDGEAVGGIGYVPQPDVERVSAEIGYWLGEPYWNRGMMSEAVRRLSEEIFATTEIIRLFAPVFEFNKPSMRVLEKAGFEKVAVLGNAAIKNGWIIDLHYYQRLK